MSGTTCAWGRNLGLCLQGGPYIWGSPLGTAHLHPRSLFLRQCCCPVVGEVVSLVGAAKGRRESLSPCPLVVWFASLGLLVWVELVPGWAPCPLLHLKPLAKTRLWTHGAGHHRGVGSRANQAQLLEAPHGHTVPLCHPMEQAVWPYKAERGLVIHGVAVVEELLLGV